MEVGGTRPTFFKRIRYGSGEGGSGAILLTSLDLLHPVQYNRVTQYIVLAKRMSHPTMV